MWTPKEEHQMRIQTAANDVLEELQSAEQAFRPMYSGHEGLAIIEEEFIELRTEVFIKQKNRDVQKMYKEAKQLAAMAIRFMVDVCDEVNGRK